MTSRQTLKRPAKPTIPTVKLIGSIAGNQTFFVLRSNVQPDGRPEWLLVNSVLWRICCLSTLLGIEVMREALVKMPGLVDSQKMKARTKGRKVQLRHLRFLACGLQMLSLCHSALWLEALPHNRPRSVSARNLRLEGTFVQWHNWMVLWWGQCGANGAVTCNCLPTHILTIKASIWNITKHLALNLSILYTYN
jgi:hypothetical protein